MPREVRPFDVLIKLLESGTVADGLGGVTGTSLLSAVMGTNGSHVISLVVHCNFCCPQSLLSEGCHLSA